MALRAGVKRWWACTAYWKGCMCGARLYMNAYMKVRMEGRFSFPAYEIEISKSLCLDIRPI